VGTGGGRAVSITFYTCYGFTHAVALGVKPSFVSWWALGLVVATLRLPYQDTWIE
jgi:hypothetical protein